MDYEFSFYQEKDFAEIEQLILASYQWEYPVWGLSRHEFTRGLHPHFTGMFGVWERTAGVYRQQGRIVACAINEANDDGSAFFLFDCQARSEEKALLREMLFFAQTTMAAVDVERNVSRVHLRVPAWNQTLSKLAAEAGFYPGEQTERLNILPFPEQAFSPLLPAGYTFADGEQTPDFYLANVHMASFHYGISRVPASERAFHALRKMRHYHPYLDLCVLDPMKRPVAMAIFWYDEKMPYCELEPLGVAWWERRKHLGTAILHEGANRVRKLYPRCQGMLGGDQPFYERIGFVNRAEVPVLNWEITLYPSWNGRSAQRDYASEVVRS